MFNVHPKVKKKNQQKTQNKKTYKQKQKLSLLSRKTLQINNNNKTYVVI